MADATPLTDEERAELEQLRAEKAARAEAEQAARERAELARLKEERATRQREAAAMQRESELREQGRRLMEPDDEDLGMPIGQKIVFGLVLVLALAVLIAQFVLRR
jgi:hypothetical protein